MLQDNSWINCKGEPLLGCVPVSAGENTDKQKGKEKAMFKPSVFVSLLRYSGDNIETRNALYVFLLKQTVSFKVI